MQQKPEIELHTPVVLIIFNRPAATEAVFEEIARARPKKLFVVADGPRADHPGDAAKCDAARAVIERVDWNCEVLKNYAEVNLGCGRRPATGISWVFEQVDEAIILEDDCVPHPTFFRFCEELLEKYRHDDRVMTITGRNGLMGRLPRSPYSYHFRRTFSCNGWATWRRAWRYYDFEIKRWPELRNTSWLMDILVDQRGVDFWWKTFDRAHAEAAAGAPYWDFQWVFACWVQNSAAAVSGVNLVRNVGFGPDATHTKSLNDDRAKWPTAEMVFPLVYPPHMAISRDAELLIIDNICNGFRPRRPLTLMERIGSRLRNMAAPVREFVWTKLR